MKYGTFKYRIDYEDGEIVEGWSPFSGETLAKYQLVAFVRSFFLGKKPVKLISVNTVFEISTFERWMFHIGRSVEYQFLRTKGFVAAQIAG